MIRIKSFPRMARAWAPGNISLLFKVMPDPDPSKMGSLGSGFTVNEGATVTVSRNDNSRNPQGSRDLNIRMNGEEIALPTVTEVIRSLTTELLKVSIETPLSLGSGFGISGASALATAHAVNALLGLEKSEHDLALVAHTAEVIHKTGLGDVGNQWVGGCCVKFVTSSLFQMERLPFAGTTVYVRSWGKIPTPSILTNATLLTAIDTAAKGVLRVLKNRILSLTFAELLNLSNEFTRRSNLISYAPHAKKVIEQIHTSGGHAAMIILGDAVVSDLPFERCTKLTIVDQGVGVGEPYG